MLTPDELEADALFPWLRGLRLKPIPPLEIPEPPRRGETEVDCDSCGQGDGGYLWTDDAWRLWPMTSFPLRGCVMLESRAHVDSFADMSPELLTDLGPVTARIERAVLSIGDVGRVHVARWGDGSGHFHLWFLPRPLGAMHLRGSGLVPWVEALDPPDASVLSEAHAVIAEAMSAADQAQVSPHKAP
jgi:diadenosine tetraphosphate (Ap4A) HIT family hydrolase